MLQERLDHMADHAITANYMALMLSIIKPRFSTERALARVALASVFQNPMEARTEAAARTKAPSNPPKLDEREARISAFLYYRWHWQLKDIAKKLKVSQGCVIKTWQRYGLHKPGQKNQKRQRNQAAPKRKMPPKFTPEQEQGILQMRREGFSFRSIAAHYNAGETTIARLVKRKKAEGVKA